MHIKCVLEGEAVLNIRAFNIFNSKDTPFKTLEHSLYLMGVEISTIKRYLSRTLEMDVHTFESLRVNRC